MTKITICLNDVCTKTNDLAVECATFDIHDNTITLGLSNETESCHIELGLSDAARLYATLFNAFKAHGNAVEAIMYGGDK